MKTRCVVVSLSLFLMFSCVKNEVLEDELPLAKELSLVEKFMLIDDSLYSKLVMDADFVKASGDYDRVKKELIFSGDGMESLKKLDEMKEVIDSLGVRFGCWNMLAYCLTYAREDVVMSRISHMWGACGFENEYGICNTYENWMGAWRLCAALEVKVVQDVYSEGFVIDVQEYRRRQMSFLGNRVNQRVQELYYRIAVQIPTNIPGSGIEVKAREYRLQDIADSYYGEDVCLQVYNLRNNFYDFYSSHLWIEITRNDGSRPDPEHGGGKDPEVNEITWNGTTHHKMLQIIGQKLRLSRSELLKLKEANDWCDSFLKGNQWSDKAYYHAMNLRADMPVSEARRIFKAHLLSQFEKFVTEGDVSALGVALHGIADSFCPAHMGFQYMPIVSPRVIEHSIWDRGEVSPQYVDYAMGIMVDVINILNGQVEVAVGDVRSPEVRAADRWSEAYDDVIKNGL